MTQKFLHGSNVIAAFEQMRGEGMPQTMGRRPLADPSAMAGLTDSRETVTRMLRHGACRDEIIGRPALRGRLAAGETPAPQA